MKSVFVEGLIILSRLREMFFWMFRRASWHGCQQLWQTGAQGSGTAKIKSGSRTLRSPPIYSIGPDLHIDHLTPGSAIRLIPDHASTRAALLALLFVYVVLHAADRQPYIDQAQSVNLFFRPDSNIKYIHAVHFMAWKQGLKTLYYCRSEKISKADKVSRKIERQVIQEIDMKALAEGTECLACE